MSSPDTTDTPAINQAAALLGARGERNVTIAPSTTYRLGGPAAIRMTVHNDDDVALLRKVVAETGIDVLIIGNGSNMLVADRGFAGLVVSLASAFAEIEISAGGVVRAGGAVSLPVLARRTAAASLTGLEWAVGVPGTVGGAVRMNAGGHGSQVVESLSRCRLASLAGARDEVVQTASLDLSYRHSNIEVDQLVLWAEFSLRAGEREQSEREIADIVRWRRDHQPGGRNAGSVFINPSDDSAGRLVDVSGCRGLRMGSASVSDKHANFIQSDDGGLAADVLALIVEVRRRVLAETGVSLKPEVRLVGFTDEELSPLWPSDGVIS